MESRSISCHKTGAAIAAWKRVGKAFGPARQGQNERNRTGNRKLLQFGEQ
jgi:hypothetical protein